MSTQKELELKFKNAAGQSRTLNIRAPKEGVTKGEVDTACRRYLRPMSLLLPAAIWWKRWKDGCALRSWSLWPNGYFTVV